MFKLRSFIIKPKVAIIDDFIDQIAVKTLSMRGYDVKAYRKPDEGLAAVKKNSPDVLLLDINMPEKNGYQVLKEIRTSNLTFPVIIMSGKSENEIEKTVELGANDYITKPYRYPDLIEKINNQLKK